LVGWQIIWLQNPCRKYLIADFASFVNKHTYGHKAALHRGPCEELMCCGMQISAWFCHVYRCSFRLGPSFQPGPHYHGNM